MKLLLLSLLSLSLATLLPVSHAGSVICTPSPLELVFAVDVSSSLTEDDFAKVKGFLKSLAESLPLGPDKTRPAVISFSTNAKVESNLGKADNVPAFRKAVDAIPYYRGFTATGMALRLARKRVFVKSRTGASKLLVVVTDGRTNHPGTRLQALKRLRKESAMLRAADTRIHAVGVGDIQLKEELREISGGEDFSVVHDFSQLEQLVEKLAKDICEVHCTDVGKVVHLPGPCYNGTQRITTVAKKHNKEKKRCEKEISYNFKYCGHSHKCKAIEVTVGDCVNGVREIVTSWEDFDVAQQKCVMKKSVQKMSCDIIEECKEPVADIMFVLDSSGSIKNRDWKLQLDFVKAILQNMRVAPNAIRAGVVIFGTKSWTDIRLGAVTDKRSLLQRVGRLRRRSNQWTATGKGIQAARTEFRQRGRSGVRRLAVVMTDGASNKPPNAIQQAAMLENEGATIIVVGVGSLLIHNELEGIATPPLADHLFFAEDFDKLVAWAGKISEETCESIAPPDPSLCDLPPQRVISDCYNGIRKITEIRYVFDSHGMCTKKIVSRILNKCELLCTDPINGNHYNKGETWKSECATFTCRRPATPTSPLRPTSQGCLAANGTCYSPSASAHFACHDEEDQLFSHCLCAASNRVRIITADANSQP